MSYINKTNELVEKVVNDLAEYLYQMASLVEGDVERHDTYMDAGDALVDVVAMWEGDVMFFAQQAASAATLTVTG